MAKISELHCTQTFIFDMMGKAEMLCSDGDGQKDQHLHYYGGAFGSIYKLQTAGF